MFPQVNSKQSFPELEEKILKFWKENNTFKKSLELRKDSEEFKFYDGPPFATGTPHHGHLLAWIIKDAIPRFQTMKWKRVDRMFGWDCHGLPIENIVEKKLWISGKKDIEDKIWIFEFNEECQKNVFGYVDVWKKTVEKSGRWVDMENDYKTMDVNFMESIWWVFKTIYDKWLIYESYRVVPYCIRCSTPLSNFEVNQWYEDRQDKTVTVKFKIKWVENKFILAWTTTPWTLPANVWLAVWKDIEYVEILDKNWEIYILAKDRLASFYKEENDYEIKNIYKWSDLVGTEYNPIFDDFISQKENWTLPKDIVFWKNSYKVILGHHVTTEDGTWVVHIAPAYWEDDFEIWKREDLWFISHIDATWNTENLLENNSINVFDFNEIVINKLKEKKLLIHIWTINHSYPFCYRCKTPLIYKAISAWYINVEKIKDKMILNNEKVKWIPEIIKHWRFGKWIEWARDWNISRNRYWWSTIPIWKSEDKTSVYCIWSVKELYELNKDFWDIYEENWKYFYTKTKKEIDLHKHFIDEIKIKDPKTWKTMQRISEVLDCWFESWSMPYASRHYPFENKENFKVSADFIAEWVDQTRWWFYTLLILWTALFDNTPFLNVIVNWTILAEDGKKMSKSLRNYTEPDIILDKYWADAMRFYLLNSPAVKADDIRFNDSWVEEIIKKVILPIWNTYSFFTTYANIDNFKPEEWSIYFIRHWQSELNKKWKLADWTIDDKLTEEWEEQVKKAALDIKNKWLKFDIIITSPLFRTKQTAELIKEWIWYDIEIIEDERFKEHKNFVFSWKTEKEIMDHHIENWWQRADHLWKIIKQYAQEILKDFENRVEEWYKEIQEKYKWKNVLIVSHWWVFRVLNKYVNNLNEEKAYYIMPSIKNANLIKLRNYQLTNLLDKWIISQLNILIKDVNNAFESYDLQVVTKSIFNFIDNLTNWYIRRSRRRFWKSENDNDKMQAYNTLYEVLVEFCKIIAPVIPFLSEEIFKNLTNKESVHLEYFPEHKDAYIFNNLNKSMEKTQQIINLWLSLRANKKIRVRQPLSSITIWEKLDQYYENILKEELNIKEIKFLDNLSSIAKKICKPNAKILWPKYWQSIQEIIRLAKDWQFEEKENWVIFVWSYELQKEEYEIAYETLDSSLDIQVWFGMVIAMDTNITEELKIEWYARDIVRIIQDLRKEASYNVDDRIQICIYWDKINTILELQKNYIEQETLSKIVDKIDIWDIEKEEQIDDFTIKIVLKR